MSGRATQRPRPVFGRNKLRPNMNVICLTRYRLPIIQYCTTFTRVPALLLSSGFLTCRSKCSGPEKRTHAGPESGSPGPDPDAIAKSPVGPDLRSIHIVTIIHGRGMRVLLRGEIVSQHRLHGLTREETHSIQ